MIQTDENKAEKFAYIVAMRAVAILMVIIVHTSQKVKGLSFVVDALARYCQMGVQHLFVVSAFTLCLSHARRETESNSVIKFYIIRYFRIAPLYYIAIFIYFSVHLITQQMNHLGKLDFYPYTTINILENMFFIHGFSPSANNNIVPGGWSIGTEMAFYAIFPILFKILDFQYSNGGQIRLWGIALVALLMNIILQTFFISINPKTHINDFMYYNLMNQLPVFMIGMIAFFRSQSPQVRFPWQINAIAFIIFTVLFLAVWSFKFEISFALVPFFSAISFLCLLELFKKLTSFPKFIIKTGKLSYSMYILHFIFAWYFSGLIVSFPPLFISSDFQLIILVFVSWVMTYFFARITVSFIEELGMRLGKMLISKLDGFSMHNLQG